jgi:hypothetical protein
MRTDTLWRATRGPNECILGKGHPMETSTLVDYRKRLAISCASGSSPVWSALLFRLARFGAAIGGFTEHSQVAVKLFDELPFRRETSICGLTYPAHKQMQDRASSASPRRAMNQL